MVAQEGATFRDAHGNNFPLISFRQYVSLVKVTPAVSVGLYSNFSVPQTNFSCAVLMDTQKCVPPFLECPLIQPGWHPGPNTVHWTFGFWSRETNMMCWRELIVTWCLVSYFIDERPERGFDLLKEFMVYTGPVLRSLEPPIQVYLCDWIAWRVSTGNGTVVVSD